MPSYPPNNPENQNFEKMKKVPADTIILQKSTINDNHMMYGFSDMECNRQFFFILSHLLPSCPTNNLQNLNFEKLEKKPPGDTIILDMCTKNDNHMMYGS